MHAIASPSGTASPLHCMRDVVDVDRGEPVGVFAPLLCRLHCNFFLCRCCCSSHCEDVVSVSELPRAAWPALQQVCLMLQLRCLMLLLSTAFQRGCVLLLCFVCGDRTKEAQHGDLARKQTFLCQQEASEINFIQGLAERNSEYSQP